MQSSIGFDVRGVSVSAGLVARVRSLASGTRRFVLIEISDGELREISSGSFGASTNALTEVHGGIRKWSSYAGRPLFIILFVSESQEAILVLHVPEVASAFDKMTYSSSMPILRKLLPKCRPLRTTSFADLNDSILKPKVLDESLLSEVEKGLREADAYQASGAATSYRMLPFAGADAGSLGSLVLSSVNTARQRASLPVKKSAHLAMAVRRSAANPTMTKSPETVSTGSAAIGQGKLAPRSAFDGTTSAAAQPFSASKLSSKQSYSASKPLKALDVADTMPMSNKEEVSKASTDAAKPTTNPDEINTASMVKPVLDRHDVGSSADIKLAADTPQEVLITDMANPLECLIQGCTKKPLSKGKCAQHWNT